ncbi:MAG: hypothetical protein CSB48_11920 [Proteobacteria bacterium]|nr:MAG: hypothetical protein CSB48_11920 [Pseudomonadota bacterium]
MDQSDIILKSLRVPHLYYTLGGEHHFDPASEQRLIGELTSLRADKSGGLIEWYRHEFKNARLRPELVNSLFVADRIFDGFFRKNNFADSVCQRANKWRYIFACALIRAKNKTAFAGRLLKTIDLFLQRQIGVSISAGSSRNPFFRTDETMDAVFFSEELFNEDKLACLFQTLKQDLERQDARRRKSVSRLLESEAGLARAGYAADFSQRIVAEVFQGRALPELIETFLIKDWMPAIKRWVSLGAGKSDEESFRSLTQSLGVCFACAPGKMLSSKNNRSFMLVAPTLIDSLDQIFSTRNSITKEIHNRLGEMQNMIIQLLQNVTVETRDFSGVPDSGRDSQCDQPLSSKLELAMNDERWFVDMETDARFQIAGIVTMTNQLLLINSLGAKIQLVSAAQANERYDKGLWKFLPGYVSLQSIFDETIRGLFKVSETQLKQRKNALEKAKSEVLAMRKARQEADQKAKETAEMLRAKAEKEQSEERERLRLEQEAYFLDQLEKVTLGAWIEYEREGKKEKGKLAVKTASTQKWIFVDRYGLNRFEIIKSDLLTQLIEGQARILNAGTAFDESLERTVSRIRMSKT